VEVMIIGGDCGRTGRASAKVPESLLTVGPTARASGTRG
jgi:hypothetical protein